MEQNNSSKPSMCKKIRQVLFANNNIQTKPPLPPHHKDHIGKSEAEEISSTKRTTKVSKPQPQYVPMQGNNPLMKAKGRSQLDGHGFHSEHQGKKSTDINDTFNDYIRSAKKKIKSTMSSVGHSQREPAAATDHEARVTNKNETHKDHFWEFIHRNKKKIRATTMARKGE